MLESGISASQKSKSCLLSAARAVLCKEGIVVHGGHLGMTVDVVSGTMWLCQYSLTGMSELALRENGNWQGRRNGLSMALQHSHNPPHPPAGHGWQRQHRGPPMGADIAQQAQVHLLLFKAQLWKGKNHSTYQMETTAQVRGDMSVDLYLRPERSWRGRCLGNRRQHYNGKHQSEYIHTVRSW